MNLIKSYKKWKFERIHKQNLKNNSFWLPWDTSLSSEIKEGDFIMIEKLDETIDYIAGFMGLDSCVKPGIRKIWRVVRVFEKGGLCLEGDDKTRILTSYNNWLENVMSCEAGFLRDACRYAFYYRKPWYEE